MKIAIKIKGKQNLKGLVRARRIFEVFALVFPTICNLWYNEDCRAKHV